MAISSGEGSEQGANGRPDRWRTDRKSVAPQGSSRRKKRRVAITVVVCVLVVLAGLLLIWRTDEVRLTYEPVADYPHILEWGEGECAFQSGVTSIDDIVRHFGSPAEVSPDGRRCTWRSYYHDGFYVYRHWLYRTRVIGSMEAFFLETVSAEFDEDGVLRTWWREAPLSGSPERPPVADAF
jgi:hypothetical protein